MTKKLMVLTGIVLGNFLWQTITSGNYMEAAKISYFQMWAVGTILAYEYL